MFIRKKQVCVKLSDREADDLYNLSDNFGLSGPSLIRYLIKQHIRRFGSYNNYPNSGA